MPVLIAYVVLVLCHLSVVEARTFGNCVYQGQNVTGWARLLDYRCDITGYLVDLLSVCIPGFVLLGLLLIWILTWVTWLCCRCLWPACNRVSEVFIVRVLNGCSRGYATRRFRRIVRLGSVVVLLFCIAALALSWTGFLLAHDGFYDALDQWGAFISRLVGWAEEMHSGVSTAEQAVLGLDPAINVTVPASEVTNFNEIFALYVRNFQAMKEDYDKIRDTIDLFYNILLGVMVLYTVLLFFLTAALPLNVYKLQWNRYLPRFLTAAFFAMGICVCFAVIATEYLSAFFDDVCEIAESWIQDSWRDGTGLFDYLGCQSNATIFFETHQSLGSILNNLSADVCGEVCVCDPVPVSGCGNYTCSPGATCALWATNATVIESVSGLLSSVVGVGKLYSKSLLCLAVLWSIIDPVRDICQKVPEGFHLLLIGSIVMSVSVALGLLETMCLSEAFQRSVRALDRPYEAEELTEELGSPTSPSSAASVGSEATVDMSKGMAGTATVGSETTVVKGTLQPIIAPLDEEGGGSDWLPEPTAAPSPTPESSKSDYW